MKSILNYLQKVPEVAGVEIYLLQQGKMSIRYAILKQKQNRVLFCKGEYHLESLNDLKNAIGAQIPVVISLNGQGIIHRSFELKTETRKEEYVRKIFPNTAIDDFYVQESRSEKRVFISLARREMISGLMSLFEELEIPIFSLSLGPFAIQSLWKHSEAPTTGEFRLDGHQFNMVEGDLENYHAVSPMGGESKKTTLAGEEINECLAIAYATALSTIAGLPLPQLMLDKLSMQREEYVHKGIFKRLAVGMMGLFLVILLFNSFFYYRYSSTLVPNQIDQIDALKKEEEELQRLLDDQLAVAAKITRPMDTHYASLSQVADLLAANVPPSVTLNDMTIFPSDKELSRKERRPVYDFNRVSIHGIAETGEALNHWLSDIRQIDYCKNVEIGKYSSTNASTSTFTIELSIE